MKEDVIQLTIPTPFDVGDVHCYVIKSDTVTLVDTGPKTKDALDEVTRQLALNGLQPSDIDQIFLTHHHPDHAGLLEQFEGAVILGAAETERWLTRPRPFMEAHDRFFTGLFTEMGLPPAYFRLLDKMKEAFSMMGSRGLDRIVKEGDVLPGSRDWHVIGTEGHAQGHLSLYSASGLIGGDVLLDRISSNPLLEPPVTEGDSRPLPQLQYNESLRKIRSLKEVPVFPGHGAMVTQSHELIDHRLQKQHDRAMKVKGMLTEKQTGFDLCRRLFPVLYKKQLGLTLSETLGQLDYLTDRGDVTVTVREDGALLYEPSALKKELVYEQGSSR